MNPVFFATALLSIVSINALMAQNDCECAEEVRRRPRIIALFNAGKVEDAVNEFTQIQRAGSPECRIAYCNAMAQVYFNKNETNRIRPLMEEERRLLDSIHCGNRAYARHFNTYGNFYLTQNNYPKAADNFLAALRKSEGTDYVFGQQRALTSLSIVFAQLEQFDKVLFYLKRAEKIAREMKNQDELGSILVRTGASYLSLYEKTNKKAFLDSALTASSSGLNLAKSVKSTHIHVDALIGLANHARLTRQFVQGLSFADSALLLTPADLGYKYRYEVFRAKSQLYQAQRNYDSAAIFADSALKAAEKFNPQMQVNALAQVYEIQKQLRHFPQALAAYERMSVLEDSLSSMDKFNAINELEQQYNRVKNEKSIKELTQSQEIVLLRNRQLLSGILIALLAIAALIFLLHQRTLNARQLKLETRQIILETEQRLNRARMNPHFLFNALGALQALVMTANDNRKVVSYLAKFATIMRQTLESTYTDYISLAKEKEYLEKYLDLQRLRFPDAFNFSIEIPDSLEGDRIMIPPMLVQPFAENAIEHGFTAGNAENVLRIRFSPISTHKLLLEIEDNGQGLRITATQKEQHISRATQIIRDSLAIIGQKYQVEAHLEVKNKPDGGVLAQIFLPLIQQPV